MNCVDLTGRLTKDVELRCTKSGKPVASFTLAVKRRLARPEDPQQADFFPIIVWGQQGEACSEHIVKGSLVAIHGRLQTRSYEAQDGSKRYVTEVIAEDVDFLASAKKPDEPSQAAEEIPF